jgi:hypothetical protein
LAAVALVGSHGGNLTLAATPTASPTAAPVFFQETGPLSTPFRVCNGGDGYSYVPCTVGPVIGSDHAGGH